VTACAFCEIVAGRGHADIVFESERVIAFLPLELEVRGHTLVAPKAHHATLFDMPNDVLASVMQDATVVCRRLMTGLRATGINLLHASGTSAQQSVAHFHMHVLPRFDGDGVNAWPSLPGWSGDRAELLARLR
jgi:histidine triad (HIT) family protein